MVQGLDAGTLNAVDMDKVLHPERVMGRGKHRHKPTFTTRFGSIPDGVMFHQEGDQAALLKWKGWGWAWAPEEYREGTRMDQGQVVEVLTPRTVVEVIGALLRDRKGEPQPTYAGRLGLKQGDVLLQVNSRPVSDHGDLMEALRWTRRFRQVTAQVQRGQQTVHLSTR